MKRLLPLLLVMSACLSEGADRPGTPELSLWPEYSWIQGEVNEARAEWTYACTGTGDWGCPSSSGITLLSTTCDRCVVLDGPVSPRPGGEFHAMATSDSTLTVGATIQFNDTGEIATVHASMQGDHEDHVEARCAMIDTAELAQRDLQQPIPGELFRLCLSPRRASDSIVVFPALVTVRGTRRSPGCADADCPSSSTSRLRSLSTVVIDPSPTGWGNSDELGPARFAIVPVPPAGGNVLVTAQLSLGGTVIDHFHIPPIR
jgi:hypothetical protein